MGAEGGPLDPSGLDISPERVDAATHIDLDEWRQEFELQGEFFKSLGDDARRCAQRETLMARVG